MGRYCQLLDPTYFLSLSCALKRDIARQGGVPVWRRACLTSLSEGGSGRSAVGVIGCSLCLSGQMNWVACSW